MELSPISENDAPAFAALSFSIGMTPSLDVPAAAGFIRHVNSDRAIGRKLVVDGVFVGGGQLTLQKYPHSVELGFWVSRDSQGRGYGSLIARLLTEMALKELKYHRVFAKTSSANIKSQRCLERAGMIREGVLRDSAVQDGRFLDEIIYSRLKTD